MYRPNFRTVVTQTVNEKMIVSYVFTKFVTDCLHRFSNNDWGDICEEDKQANDLSWKESKNVLASYTAYPDADFDKIWITSGKAIEGSEDVVVTVLFPDEY